MPGRVAPRQVLLQMRTVLMIRWHRIAPFFVSELPFKLQALHPLHPISVPPFLILLPEIETSERFSSSRRVLSLSLSGRNCARRSQIWAAVNAFQGKSVIASLGMSASGILLSRIDPLPDGFHMAPHGCHPARLLQTLGYPWLCPWHQAIVQSC